MAIRVLVVEDDDLMRSSLTSALSHNGRCVAFEAHSSAEAIRIGSHSYPDVALLDLHLGPGPNGIDVAIALRKQNPLIGIVFLTTFEDPRLLSDHRRLPRASRYILKNSVPDVDSLTRVIEEAQGAKEDKIHLTSSNSGVKLNDAQFETLRLVAQGLSNAEIAKRRLVTEKSVEAMLTRISKSLNIPRSTSSNSRVQLVRKYYELSGLPPNAE